MQYTYKIYIYKLKLFAQQTIWRLNQIYVNIPHQQINKDAYFLKLTLMISLQSFCIT